MADKVKTPETPHTPNTEEIDPAPWLGRVGDGATLAAGEYISRELRELTERARAHREAHRKPDR